MKPQKSTKFEIKMKNFERLINGETADRLKNFPLYSQEDKAIKDTVVNAVFALGSLRWYVTEGSAEGDTFTMFGLVVGLDQTPELGYINADELASIEIQGERMGMPGEVFRVQALHGFQPCKFADIANDERVTEWVARFSHYEEEEHAAAFGTEPEA